MTIQAVGDTSPTEGYCLYTKVSYNYRLARDMVVKVALWPPPEAINTDYFELREDGTLIIKRGYAWDGASGPTAQTGSIIWPSAPHDCFYQMFREGLLSSDLYREQVDKAFADLCKQAGMWSVRAAWVHQAVRLFGAQCAQPVVVEILRAP